MKKITSFATILVIIMGMFTSNLFASIYYTDVPEEVWYRDDINYIAQDARDILKGFPDGSFHPNDSFTVAQLLTCVVIASYYQDLKKVKSAGNWYDPFINKAKELKYIEDREFISYDMSVSRGNMAKILVRAAENITSKYTYRDAQTIIPLIKDYDSTPENLKEYVVKAYDMGLISGFPDGTFGANKILNRAQAVAVLRKLIDPTKRTNANISKVQAGSILGIDNYVYKVNPDMPKELYEYAYISRKSDNSLQTNKWAVENLGLNRVIKWMELAKSFMNTFYKVDYRTLNKEKYRESLKVFFVAGSKWQADDNVIRPVEEHMKYWVDMIEQKQIIITSEFITDPSLFYGRGEGVTRGKFIYTVESCNDMVWLKNYTKFGNVQLGKKYSCLLEVETMTIALAVGSTDSPEVLNYVKQLTPVIEVK